MATAQTSKPKIWLKKASITVPALFSLLATGVAGTSLGIQLAGMFQAQNAAKFALAKLVATYQQPDERDVVVIQNLGQQPVYDLYLKIAVTLRDGEGISPTDGFRWFFITVLPPCAKTAIKFAKPRVLDLVRWGPTNSAVPVGLIRHAAKHAAAAVSALPESLMFTDANGQDWTESPRSGTLATTSSVSVSAVAHPPLDGVRSASCIS